MATTNRPPTLPNMSSGSLKAIQHANSERAAVLSVLDAGEIDFLYATAPRLLEGDSDSARKEKTEAEKREDEARLLRFYQLVLKLDIPRLLNAAAEVARALDLETLAALDKKAGKLEHYPSRLGRAQERKPDGHRYPGRAGVDRRNEGQHIHRGCRADPRLRRQRQIFQSCRRQHAAKPVLRRHRLVRRRCLFLDG